jgi:hypothetical protein
MAYYLGRDIGVWILTESTSRGVQVTSNEAALGAADTKSAAYFAQPLLTGSVVGTYQQTDVTGLDLSIGVVDEDITYIGQRSVLKAEIKKETTVSLTIKKSDNLSDVIFNGPTKSGDEYVSGVVNHGARWGISTTGGNVKISDGLHAPKDHLQSTNVSFGYRLIIKLNSGEYFAVPACQLASHTVTLNADGTTEETIEFSSNVTPIITAEVDSDLVGRITSTDI